MNRKIKFRAWDKVNKRFFYITLHPTQLNWASPKFAEQELLKEIDGDICAVYFKNIEGWQQFTSLKDKNGKEIYEGDIIIYWSKEGYPNKKFNKVIRWDSGNRSAGFNIGKNIIGTREIIGNIYENPNLLT